jgi:hypothetical protein
MAWQKKKFGNKLVVGHFNVRVSSYWQTSETHNLNGIPAKPNLHEGKILIFSVGLSRCVRSEEQFKEKQEHTNSEPSISRQQLKFWPRLVPKSSSKFHYAKKRFPVTSKYRQMHRVLNIDEIKN